MAGPSFDTGSTVRVVASDQYAAHLRPEDLAKLIGKEGIVTGRTLNDLVEVRIADAVVPQAYGYLLHPAQLEAAEAEPVPEGQLCDRLKNYETHEAYSATWGSRGGRCDRRAKARDGTGTWACGVHLGADKRGEQNRQRGANRRSWKYSKERRALRSGE